MNQISIIFPNQLFRESPILKINCEVLILEDSLFFGNDKFDDLSFRLYGPLFEALKNK